MYSAYKKARALKHDEILHVPWTAFVRCVHDEDDPESIIFLNSRYQVHCRTIYSNVADMPNIIHLSFKRLDQGIFIPYRDKMRIKDELVGSECEAVEIYPARSREVDTANQYHLWVFNSPTFRLPFGYAERFVTDVSYNGSVQKKWPKHERPADCLNETQLADFIHNKHAKM